MEDKHTKLWILAEAQGDLKSIPLDYLRNLDATKSKRRPFGHKLMRYPVILVLDNDDGLKDVASIVKTNFDVQITVNATDRFYHITENLYLVKTPETSGKGCIEDLFPEKWRRKRA